MNLYSTYLGNFKIWYFSEDNSCWKIPQIWLRFIKKENKWRMCGSMFFLDAFLPESFRNNGFKTKEKAFSYLYALHKMFHSLDKKTKKKLCMVKLNGDEYIDESIWHHNHIYQNISQRKS